MKDIYLGAEADGKYVPKLGDDVRDTGIFGIMDYRVVELDESTLIPTFKFLPPAKAADVDETDALLGVGPGINSTARCWIDKRVMPYTLTVDTRLEINGVQAKYAMIFKGSVVDSAAKIISVRYDSGGTKLGNDIPLELVYMPNGQNFGKWCVPTCNTTEDLLDNDRVTVVWYSDAGIAIGKQTLIVEETTFIPSVDGSNKYVKAIRMEGPFMSKSDLNVMNYPMNVPLAGLNLRAFVEYSDGTEKDYNIDGTRFSLGGFEDFAATVVGQKVDLLLSYKLQANEAAYGITIGPDRQFPRDYTAIVTNALNQYTPKLFGYPVWVDDLTGYRMEWFLYNLDREVAYRVTPWVELAPNSPAFNPKLYGTTQRLTYQIILSKANGSYPDYKHVQTIDINLLAQGSTANTPWSIGFEPTQSPLFGIDSFAATKMINQNLWSINLASGDDSLATWLTRFYYNTKPLYDTTKESAPLEPNYFALVMPSGDVEFPISQWGSDLPVSYTTDATSTDSAVNALANNGTLFVKFIKRTGDNDLQLAVAGVRIKQQS